MIQVQIKVWEVFSNILFLFSVHIHLLPMPNILITFAK